MATTARSPDEVARIGKEIYEREVRAKVETEDNIGRILVLDIESGDYAIDADHHTAADLAYAKRPGGTFYGIRVGYRAVGRIGGSMARLKRC